MNIRITNIGVANPRYRLSQREVLGILNHKKTLSRREKSLYQRFLSDKGIGCRYFSVRNRKDFFVEDQDRLITRFQESAARLSTASLKKCLEKSGVTQEEIDCVVVSTCTGYLCPGLTSYVIERAGLRRDIFALDIAGMGCGGALPALQACHHFLNAHKNATALAISTEICSAALFWGDDPELVLSNSIFGDGSAACLLSNKKGQHGFNLTDFASRIEPKHRELLRFRTEKSQLRNVIKPAVPNTASSLTKELAESLFQKNGLKQAHIKFWALHPGGRKVLDSVQATMNLSKDDMDSSRRVLRYYGNMSSPTVVYVLKDIYQNKRPKSGDAVFMASFGAGFSAYAALLCCE